MSALEFAALVLAVVGPLLALAGHLRVPPSLALVAVGFGSAYVPGLPDLRVDPQLLISLFLPPVIYAATVQVSVHLLRFTLLPGVLIGAALTAATIPAVAMAARWLLPGLDWTPALVLGVIAALFDTRLFHEAKGRPHVPRAIADALKAREMVARVIALGVLAQLVGSIEKGPPGALEAVARFGWSVLAGAAVGWVLGWAVVRTRDGVEPAPVEIAVSVALPFLAALAARGLGLSVPGTIMAAALTVSAIRINRDTGAPRTSSETRIVAAAFWEGVSLLLSSVLFLLAGRALPEALGALESWPLWRMVGTAAVLMLLVLALQFGFSLMAAALPAPAAALRERHAEDEAGTTRLMAAGVMAWACTPSVIGLVAALSAPPSLQDRGLLLLVAAFLVLGSVAVQGATLKLAVRSAALGSGDEEEREQHLAEWTAAAATGDERAEGKGHDAARRALLQLREENRIGDEMLRKMLREADLRSRADEGPAAALPGAGPPNP